MWDVNNVEEEQHWMASITSTPTQHKNKTLYLNNDSFHYFSDLQLVIIIKYPVLT